MGSAEVCVTVLPLPIHFLLLPFTRVDPIGCVINSLFTKLHLTLLPGEPSCSSQEEMRASVRETRLAMSNPSAPGEEDRIAPDSPVLMFTFLGEVLRPMRSDGFQNPCNSDTDPESPERAVEH